MEVHENFSPSISGERDHDREMGVQGMDFIKISLIFVSDDSHHNGN